MEGIAIQQSHGQIQGLGSKGGFGQKSTSDTHFINVLAGLIIASEDEINEIIANKDSLAELIKGFCQKSQDFETTIEAQELMAYLFGYSLENPQFELMVNELKEESLIGIQSLQEMVSNEGNQIVEAFAQSQRVNDEDLQIPNKTFNDGKFNLENIEESLQLKKEIQDTAKIFSKTSNEVISVSSQESNKETPQQAYWSENEFNRLVQKARNEISSLQLNKPVVSEGVDVEKLQKLVETGLYQLNGMPLDYQNYLENISQGQEIAEVQDFEGLNKASIVNQVETNLIKHLEDNKQEFVIKLKPKELGEITVRLIQENENLILNMTAVSESTTKLLNSQLSLLQEALRPYQAQIHPVVTQAEASQEVSLYQNNSFSHSGQHSFTGFSRENSQGKYLMDLYEKNSIDSKENDKLENIIFKQQGLDRYI